MTSTNASNSWRARRTQMTSSKRSPGGTDVVRPLVRARSGRWTRTHPAGLRPDCSEAGAGWRTVCRLVARAPMNAEVRQLQLTRRSFAGQSCRHHPSGRCSQSRAAIRPTMTEPPSGQTYSRGRRRTSSSASRAGSRAPSSGRSRRWQPSPPTAAPSRTVRGRSRSSCWVSIAFVLWIAHVYAHALSESLSEGRPLRVGGVRRLAGREFGIMAGIAPPSHRATARRRRCVRRDQVDLARRSRSVSSASRAREYSGGHARLAERLHLNGTLLGRGCEHGVSAGRPAQGRASLHSKRSTNQPVARGRGR